MRDVMFRGKTKDSGQWVYGYYVCQLFDKHIIIERHGNSYTVNPETVGQYTGFSEFAMNDKNVCLYLYEGDIVEVWSRRRPWYEDMFGSSGSQYDVECKARAVVKWNERHGCWKLDYENAYNRHIEELKGKEYVMRTVRTNDDLSSFGYHASPEDEERHRERNAHYKWSDIVIVGNIHDNPELLEGVVS